MNTQTLERNYGSALIIMNYLSGHPPIFTKQSYW